MLREVVNRVKLGHHYPRRDSRGEVQSRVVRRRDRDRDRHRDRDIFRDRDRDRDSDRERDRCRDRDRDRGRDRDRDRDRDKDRDRDRDWNEPPVQKQSYVLALKPKGRILLVVWQMRKPLGAQMLRQ